MRSRLAFLSVAIMVAAIGGLYAWYRLRPPGIPAGFVSSNGRIEATEIDLATKYAGRIEQVLVRDGDVVDAGQVVTPMASEVSNHDLHKTQGMVMSLFPQRGVKGEV